MLKQIGSFLSCWSRSAFSSLPSPRPPIHRHRSAPSPPGSHILIPRPAQVATRARRLDPSPRRWGLVFHSLSLSLSLSHWLSLLTLKFLALVEYLFCLILWCAEFWPCGVLVLVSGSSGPCEMVPELVKWSVTFFFFFWLNRTGQWLASICDLWILLLLCSIVECGPFCHLWFVNCICGIWKILKMLNL